MFINKMICAAAMIAAVSATPSFAAKEISWNDGMKVFELEVIKGVPKCVLTGLFDKSKSSFELYKTSYSEGYLIVRDPRFKMRGHVSILVTVTFNIDGSNKETFELYAAASKPGYFWAEFREDNEGEEFKKFITAFENSITMSIETEYEEKVIKFKRDLSLAGTRAISVLNQCVYNIVGEEYD